MPTKVVVSLLAKEQEFQALQAADAVAAAKRTGLELEVIYAKNNSRLQIEQIYHFIHLSSRPAAIIVQTVAGDGLPQVARDATKAGVGWVLLNREADYIEELRKEHSSLCIGAVTIDQIGIGRIQGRQFRKILPGGGNALYIQGPPDTSAARDRLRGVEEVLQGTSINLRVLNGDWTEAGGERAVRSWLNLSSSQGLSLNLVAAQNDAMATGARAAIATQRPEWLGCPFTGCDGLVDGGQRLVREGQLAATVILPPTAGAAVNMVASHQRMANTQTRIVLTPKPYPANV